MKYLIFMGLFVFGISNASISQDYRYSIGLSYQPFAYYNYNESDWNNRPLSYPVSPDGFNGFGAGVKFDYQYYKSLYINFGMYYSKQKQEHILLAAHSSDGEGNILETFYGWEASVQYEIIKMPISFKFQKELSFNSGIFFNCYFGPQISFLMDYKALHVNYWWDFEKNEYVIDKDRPHIITVRTPYHGHQTIWDDPFDKENIRINEYDTPFYYSRFLFGLASGIGISKTFLSHFSIGLDGIFEYDFTNSEKYPEKAFTSMGGNAPADYIELGAWPDERTKSHNVRLGFSISLKYLIE